MEPNLVSSMDKQNVLAKLMESGGEGDLNCFDPNVIVELLREELIQVFSSSKPFINIRLTPKGGRRIKWKTNLTNSI